MTIEHNKEKWQQLFSKEALAEHENSPMTKVATQPV